MNKNNYTADTIQKLNFCDAVRKYPGMYIGSKDADGLNHLVKEVVSNSVDEYLNGSCTEICVTINKNGSITISDNGRGIPIVEDKSRKSPLEMCFTEEHAGGKFLNATGESGYNSAGGMHGLGTKCVNALSKTMKVISVRDGKKEEIEFQNYEVKSHIYSKSDSSEHGVSVTFMPDKKYLEVVEFDGERIKTMLKEFAYLNKRLTFKFKDIRVEDNEIFYSENGLYDYLDYLNNGAKTICDFCYFEESEGTFKVEVAFGYNDKYTSITKLYTNSIPQTCGHHLTGFRTAFTGFMNSFAREKGWLKEKDSNLMGDDYLEGQMLIINFQMIDPVFKGQNKEELSSTEGRTYVQKFATKALKEIGAINEKTIKAIFDKAIVARRAREAAKKAKDAVHEIKPRDKSLRSTLEISNKFIDCRSKKPSERSLLLVEGLSAGGSVIESRNPQTDAIYMLRGKILSVLKCDKNKIMANQELSDIIRIIGAGFDNNFNVNKMAFDKIVITADQDADGQAIELLLITFFYTYMKDLVLQGKLYRAVTPLYIIETKKGKFYCYSEKELEEWKKSWTGGAYELVHAKGLGELSAQVLKEICFEKQRYKRITVSDVEAATKLLDILEGESIGPRKQFIYDNAENLGFNFM